MKFWIYSVEMQQLIEHKCGPLNEPKGSVGFRWSTTGQNQLRADLTENLCEYLQVLK